MSSSKQRRTQLTTPMMKIIPIMMKEATRIRINRRSSSSLKRQIIQLAEPFTILIRPQQKQNEEQESFETCLGNIFLRLGNLEWKHLFTKISQLLRRLNTSTELWHISKLSDIKTNYGFDQISCANNTVHRLHQTLSLYGNNRTPAHSFPARNDKLVIPESFWPEQGWSERIRALAFRHGLFIQMSFWFRPT